MSFKLNTQESPSLLKIQQFCTIENLNKIVDLLIVEKQGKVDISVIEIIRGILIVQK